MVKRKSAMKSKQKMECVRMTRMERDIARRALDDLYEAYHDGDTVKDAYDEIYGADSLKLMLRTAGKLRTK